MRMRYPRRDNKSPNDAAVMPLPRDDTTPPVIKICLVAWGKDFIEPPSSRSGTEIRQHARNLIQRSALFQFCFSLHSPHINRIRPGETGGAVGAWKPERRQQTVLAQVASESAPRKRQISSMERRPAISSARVG